jgi:hypothetical protein
MHSFQTLVTTYHTTRCHNPEIQIWILNLDKTWNIIWQNEHLTHTDRSNFRLAPLNTQTVWHCSEHGGATAPAVVYQNPSSHDGIEDVEYKGQVAYI